MKKITSTSTTVLHHAVAQKSLARLLRSWFLAEPQILAGPGMTWNMIMADAVAPEMLGIVPREKLACG